MRSGYLKSVTVGGLLDENSSVSVVYQVTKKAYELLLKRFPEASEDEAFMNKINLSHVYHDHTLSEAVWHLKKRKTDLVVKNTKVFKSKGGDQRRKPDAILIDPKSGKKCALEIELTRKSDRRYINIVTDYRLSSEYDAVLYVTKDKRLGEKIKEVIRGKNPQGFTPKDTGKFYFITAEDLLKSENSTISNGKDAIFKTKNKLQGGLEL